MIFFFASAAASSAYLTVSEIFPLELRGLAIALFYSTGTALGGPLASWLFGRLIDQGARIYLFYGDLLAAAILPGPWSSSSSSGSRPSGRRSRRSPSPSLWPLTTREPDAS